MTGIAHLLPDFAPLGAGPAGPGGTTETLREDERLEAFEKGYKDGWEDSARAHAEEQKSVGAALARTLEDLDFTRHEARQAVLAGMKPLFDALVSSFLPALAGQAVGAQIVEQLGELAAAQPDAPVVLSVAPGMGTRISALLDDTGHDVEVAEDPALAEMQAHLRAGEVEREVDLGAVQAAAAQALSDYFAQSETQERLHG